MSRQKVRKLRADFISGHKDYFFYFQCSASLDLKQLTSLVKWLFSTAVAGRKPIKCIKMAKKPYSPAMSHIEMGLPVPVGEGGIVLYRYLVEITINIVNVRRDGKPPGRRYSIVHFLLQYLPGCFMIEKG